MANERKTEIITRKLLTNKKYYFDPSKVEEQQSDIPNIAKYLKNASKKGNGNGYPEFIITNSKYPNTVIIVECKPDLTKHASATLDKFADYAVDGVLLYASYLKNGFDVIAIALSGVDEKNLKINVFKWLKDDNKYYDLIDPKTDTLVQDILSFDDFIQIIDFSPQKQKIEYDKVMEYSKNLHNYFREKAAILEIEKPILISAIILALEDKVFYNNFSTYETEEVNKQKVYNICNELLSASSKSLTNTGMPQNKISKMLQTMTFISNNDILLKLDGDTNTSLIYEIINGVKNNVYPFIKKYTEYDVIGKFYSEFIRYTGGDGSGLGIVLTPKHITEFMCDLIQIEQNSIVLDTCTGTGAFLISAMSKMIEDANQHNTDIDERNKKISSIKAFQLIGVEQQPNIFTMAAANMYFRGDGKTNFFLGSCFDFNGKLTTKINDGNTEKTLKPTHALINPPYSQKNDKLKEIDFIQFTLDQMENGGKFACIVPMSTAINSKKQFLEKKKKLLQNHRLDAVFSMPSDLFYPVSVSTCIMVFTAHVAHEKDKYHKTFFSYLKNDGFSITRKGRLDKGEWENIKDSNLDLFFNKSEMTGRSVVKKVSIKEEWCVEAYMDTDYSNLSENDFIAKIKQYIAFKLINGDINLENPSHQAFNVSLNVSSWKKFQIKDLFDVYTGGDKPKFDDVNLNYVNSIENLSTNNGVNGKISYNGKNIFNNFITMVSIGEGGTTFYQEEKSAIFTRVKALLPKKHITLNKYTAMFLITLLNQERFKYSYGRVVSGDKLKNTFIKLPIDSNDNPDWAYMEQYIKSLKYSSLL